MRKETIVSYPETVLVGDRVRYNSAEGTVRGEVVNIVKAKNALGDIVNWIHIESYNDKSPTKKSIAVLAETALPMMKFEVIFRDEKVIA